MDQITDDIFFVIFDILQIDKNTCRLEQKQRKNEIKIKESEIKEGGFRTRRKTIKSMIAVELFVTSIDIKSGEPLQRIL